MNEEVVQKIEGWILESDSGYFFEDHIKEQFANFDIRVVNEIVNIVVNDMIEYIDGATLSHQYSG